MMKIIFDYNKEKDIWCLLKKGKQSNNSSMPTKVYQSLTSEFGDDPTKNDASIFIEKYIAEKNIIFKDLIYSYQKEWGTVSSEFQRRAEAIFNVSLSEDITAYLTINSRLPYAIKENNFFVCMNNKTIRHIAMHELWHFYTWYGIGPEQEKILGKEDYNDLKEALTVIINIECKDLLPEGIVDKGYEQHQKLRQKILEFWVKDRNIKKLWDKFTTELQIYKT